MDKNNCKQDDRMFTALCVSFAIVVGVALGLLVVTGMPLSEVLKGLFIGVVSISVLTGIFMFVFWICGVTNK
jgi:hypothetical protein